MREQRRVIATASVPAAAPEGPVAATSSSSAPPASTTRSTTPLSVTSAPRNHAVTDTAAGSNTPARSATANAAVRVPSTSVAEQFGAHRARRCGDERGDREEHGAEQRSAGQRGAQFLDRDGLIDQRTADSAVGLGYREPEHAEFGAEPGPHLRVERGIGLHQPAHRLLAEVVGAELPNRVRSCACSSVNAELSHGESPSTACRHRRAGRRADPAPARRGCCA